MVVKETPQREGDTVSPRPQPAVRPEQMGEDPSIATLTGLLAERAQRSPDREFLRFGEESWTFAEIDAWTSRLAHRLIEADGLQPGDRVAIMLPTVPARVLRTKPVTVLRAGLANATPTTSPVSPRLTTETSR